MIKRIINFSHMSLVNRGSKVLLGGFKNGLEVNAKRNLRCPPLGLHLSGVK